MKIVPWLVMAEIENGSVVNRRVDLDRYEAKLGFKPHGDPKFSGRFLLLTDDGELVNVDSNHLGENWGEGRITNSDDFVSLHIRKDAADKLAVCADLLMDT